MTAVPSGRWGPCRRAWVSGLVGTLFFVSVVVQALEAREYNRASQRQLFHNVQKAKRPISVIRGRMHEVAKA